MSDIVQKPWSFCHTLRHDGIDYGDSIDNQLLLTCRDGIMHARQVFQSEFESVIALLNSAVAA